MSKILPVTTAICIVILGIGAIIEGFVVKTLWGWFITPQFDTAPDLSYAQAAGLSLLVTYVTYTYVPTKDEERIDAVISSIVVLPITVLLIGFVLHLLA